MRLTLAVLLPLALLTGACSESPSEPDQPVLGCSSVGAIQVGGSASGTLDPSDCRESAGAYVDLFELRLPSSQTITINLFSTTFDSYLVLLDRDTEQVVAQNNDQDIFTKDSRVQVTVPAGRYIIVATSYRVGEQGSYTLTVGAS